MIAGTHNAYRHTIYGMNYFARKVYRQEAYKRAIAAFGLPFLGISKVKIECLFVAIC
jgi:hypothetical protein